MRRFTVYIEAEYSETMELETGQNWWTKKYDFKKLCGTTVRFYQNSNLFEFTLYDENPEKANERVEKLMSEIMAAEPEIVAYENCAIDELVQIKLQA